MLKKYLKLEVFFKDCSFDDEVMHKILLPVEVRKLKTLVEELTKAHSVTLWLQKEDMDMYKAREMLNGMSIHRAIYSSIIYILSLYRFNRKHTRVTFIHIR